MQTTGFTSVLEFLAQNGVEILDAQHGFIRCPGEHMHGTPTRTNHCRVFPTPWVHCFHQSCFSHVYSLNSILGRHFRGKRWVSVSPRYRSLAELGRILQRQSVEESENNIRKFVHDTRESILRDYHWPYAAIIADSPERIDFESRHHWYYILNLFADEEFVWIGRDPYDSGRPIHSSRFRPALDWMGERLCPGSFVCPNVFNPNIYSRSDNNVLARKFLVVESDTLDRNSVGAIFRWLQQAKGMRLRAVVDTAGKSLHGWFEYSDSRLMGELKIQLPGLGCDPAMFRASQPCRLPGALRDGKYQTLIYLSK